MISSQLWRAVENCRHLFSPTSFTRRQIPHRNKNKLQHYIKVGSKSKTKHSHTNKQERHISSVRGEAGRVVNPISHSLTLRLRAEQSSHCLHTYTSQGQGGKAEPKVLYTVKSWHQNLHKSRFVMTLLHSCWFNMPLTVFFPQLKNQLSHICVLAFTNNNTKIYWFQSHICKI